MTAFYSWLLLLHYIKVHTKRRWKWEKEKGKLGRQWHNSSNYKIIPIQLSLKRLHTEKSITSLSAPPAMLLALLDFSRERERISNLAFLHMSVCALHAPTSLNPYNKFYWFIANLPGIIMHENLCGMTWIIIHIAWVSFKFENVKKCMIPIYQMGILHCKMCEFFSKNTYLSCTKPNLH